MQWLIASLINLVLQFLEASFRRQEQDPSSSSSKEDGPRNRHRKLQEAYAFMELTPPVSEEQLKKQYKKLSLRYHPDRNGGSQDSKVKFQKLRDCRDCIDQELAGIFDAEADEPPDDYEATGDDLYDFIQKRQAAQRKYREMQKAAEQARQEELQRQEERRKEFHSQTEPERQRCQQKRQEKGLETKPGREAAYEKFQQEANQEAKQNSSKKEPEQPHSSLGAPAKTRKPQYDIMEYNTNDMVMALRWNMPEVVFELMNQHLPAFAQTKGHELARQRIPVTAQRLKMEFMHHSIDEDDNNLLHYAIYYECYQIITMICTSSLQDGYLDSILHRPNRHGTTPLFFAHLAQDPSILSLVQNQLLINDQNKANTQILFALQSAVKRLGGLQWGILTTLDTLLSFWVAHTRFGMPAIACLAALFWTHVIYTESVYLEEIPGVHRYCAHMAFCGVWVTTEWALRLGRFKALEVAFLLTPIFVVVVFARQCAISLDLDTTLSDWVLFAPIWLPAKVGDQLERIVIRSQHYILPQMVLEKGAARSYLLLVTAVLPWSVEQVMALRS
jgi:DnaJ domain